VKASVRDQLAANASDHRRRSKAAEPSLLAALLVDAHGERLTPSHAVKKGRRYRYYVSTALISEAGQDHTQRWRLAAQEIEDCVISILVDALTSPARLLERLSSPGMPGDHIRRLLGRAARLAALLRSAPGERAKIVQGLVDQVIVDDKRIMIGRPRRKFSMSSRR
jgi:site-specific DNA recombinase